MRTKDFLLLEARDHHLRSLSGASQNPRIAIAKYSLKVRFFISGALRSFSAASQNPRIAIAKYNIKVRFSPPGGPGASQELLRSISGASQKPLRNVS